MTRSPSIAACLMVRNEADHLRRCLASVAGHVDVIHVTDTGSTDDSRSVAREFGAMVYEFPWCDDFAAARNASIRHATTDWLLCLDADDAFPQGEAEKLRSLLEANACAATVSYQIIPDYTPARSIKLIRNLPGLRFDGLIHENIRAWVREQRSNGLALQHLPVNLIHHGYTPDAMSEKIQRNLALLRREWDRCQSAGDSEQRSYIGAELGLTFAFANQTAESIELLEQLLEELKQQRTPANPGTSLPVLLNLLWVFKQAGIGERSLAACRATETVFQDVPAYQLHRGLQELEAGEFASALNWLERFKANPPEGQHATPIPMTYTGAGLWQALGSCHLGLKDYRRAADCFEEGVRLAPDLDEHKLRLLVARRMMSA